MKTKLLLMSLLLILTSCQNTFIYAPKCVHVCGDENCIEIKGSDLEGNSSDQKSDGKLSIPLSP